MGHDLPIAYNMPKRTLLPTLVAILLLGGLMVEGQPPTGGGGGKGGEKGGEFVPKNLQVLDRATFPAVIQCASVGLARPGRVQLAPYLMTHQIEQV
jgi:hypothetical protein